MKLCALWYSQYILLRHSPSALSKPSSKSYFKKHFTVSIRELRALSVVSLGSNAVCHRPPFNGVHLCIYSPTRATQKKRIVLLRNTLSHAYSTHRGGGGGGEQGSHLPVQHRGIMTLCSKWVYKVCILQAHLDNP